MKGGESPASFRRFGNIPTFRNKRIVHKCQRCKLESAASDAGRAGIHRRGKTAGLHLFDRLNLSNQGRSSGQTNVKGHPRKKTSKSKGTFFFVSHRHLGGKMSAFILISWEDKKKKAESVLRIHRDWRRLRRQLLPSADQRLD